MIRTLQFLREHPIAGQDFARTLRRYLGWQLGSRLLNVPHLLPYTDHAELLVARGDYSASNQYLCGLAEYRDQAFACHFMRSDELFVDVGANIGAYTILLAAFVHCRVLALEPAPSEFARLQRNILLNGLEKNIQALAIAAADSERTLLMTRDWGNANQVWEDLQADGKPVVPTTLRNVATRPVSGMALDQLTLQSPVTLLKIDVEGFEFRVLQGARRLLADAALEAIIIENSAQGHGGAETESLLQTLTAAGFQSIDYHPKTRAVRALTTGEQFGDNLLMVRDLAKTRARVEAAPPLRVLGCVI